MCQSDEVESLCHLQSLRGISLEMLKHLMKESPRTNNKDKSSVFTFPCFDLNNAKYLPDAVKRPCHFYIVKICNTVCLREFHYVVKLEWN